MKKILNIVPILALFLIFVGGCDAKEAGSLKTITNPYIAHYECTEAYFGDENLLDKYDYIEIILINTSKMDIAIKPKDGEKQIYSGAYSYDKDTNELSADFGILGYRFRQTTKIGHGKFTITKTIGNRQLIMNFEVK